MSLLGGADESVKMSTSPTLLLDTGSAVHSTTATVPETTAAAVGPTAAASGDWTGLMDADSAGGEEDVTAELSAPVAVAAGLGHAEWQLLAAAGAGVAVCLLLTLVWLAYRRTGACSPTLHKVVRHHDDAECPPLLDHAPRTLDFAKYLGKYILDDSTEFGERDSLAVIGDSGLERFLEF